MTEQHALVIQPAENENADDLFNRVCEQYTNRKIEQDTKGNVRVMAPVGFESSDRESEVIAQLKRWATQDGHGRSFSSSVCYVLPDGSKLSPDASWVSLERIKTLTREERRKFATVVPEFVVEIKSPSDNWEQLRDKMQDFRRNGVTLGWLIHPDKQLVVIYRSNTDAVQTLEKADSVAGEGPIEGFVLNLKPVWQGLDF